MRDVGPLGAGIQHAGEVVVIGKARGAPDLRQRIRIGTRLADLRFRRSGLRQVGRHVLTRRLQDGVDDALVARAAAVGVFERCTDIGFGHGSLAAALRSSRPLAVMISPGVQIPHCTAP